MSGFFVAVHEPRIADHVGDQDRRQPALDPGWSVLLHRMETSRPEVIRQIPWDAHSDSWVGFGPKLTSPSGLPTSAFRGRTDLVWPAGNSANDPKRTSAIGYSSQPHALTDTLAFGEIGGIVSPRAISVAADREAWIKCKSRPGGSVRLIR